MSSYSTSATTTVAPDHGGGPAIIALHPDIIQSHILNKLDGPSLAATTCASAQLLSLCKDDYLWKDVCNSTWPSTVDRRVAAAISAFPSGHRSFYNDSFPSLRYNKSNKTQPIATYTPELISAVDIFYDDVSIYSKVLVTETLSTWFLGLPFRLDLLDPKEIIPTPLKFDTDDGAWVTLAHARLRISWILIDPVKNRAVNVSSRKAVEARRHWLTEEMQFRYATVVASGGGEAAQCSVIVTCGGKEGGDLHVREVSMQVESMEGKIVNGMDSLVILQAAMEGQRCKIDGEIERERYEMFVRMKVECRERKLRREKSLDMVFIATGVSIFFAIWVYFLWR